MRILYDLQTPGHPLVRWKRCALTPEKFVQPMARALIPFAQTRLTNLGRGMELAGTLSERSPSRFRNATQIQDLASLRRALDETRNAPCSVRARLDEDRSRRVFEYKKR